MTNSTFKVRKEPCPRCLFSKDRMVTAKDAQDILAECKRRDAHFACHEFTMVDGNSQVCCKTFFDTRTTQLIRVSERLQCVEFVDPPKEAKTSKVESES